MKDKEKQICKHFDEEVCSKLDCKKDCKYYGKANCKTCIHEDICQLRTFSYCEEEVKEKGCEHYQPKIPEDSVVISREEYESLKAENDKYVKDCINYLATINKLENKVWEVEQQASKETAEKILNDIHNKCEHDMWLLKGYAVREGFAKGIKSAYTTIQIRCRKLAKQLGVEIKE